MTNTTLHHRSFLLILFLLTGCDTTTRDALPPAQSARERTPQPVNTDSVLPTSRTDSIRIIPSPSPLPESERWSYISSVMRPEREADSLVAYSIDPTSWDHYANQMNEGKILSPTVVPLAKANMIADTLELAFREGEESRTFALCFTPHHGLRSYDGLKVTDYVICFECGKFQIFRDGSRTARYLISSTAKGLMNEILGLERDTNQPPEFEPEDF